MRVLIVDDAAFMRLMLKNIFTQHGIDVVGEGVNGLDGFNKYKELRPDFVTMDLTMPECTGIEGIKLIRAFDPKAKVIMCSAMGQQSMVLEAIAAGASDFVVKPFEQSRVLEAVSRLGIR